MIYQLVLSCHSSAARPTRGKDGCVAEGHCVLLTRGHESDGWRAGVPARDLVDATALRT